MKSKDILPTLSEIPAQTLAFINSQNFINSMKDHANLEDLCMAVNAKRAHMHNLHTRLSTLLVSTVSHHVLVKSSLEDFAFTLENLSIISSHYGNREERRKIEKVVDQDLACIARELRRIESLRQYAGFALKLEVLVGDVEDEVLSSLNQHTGHVYLRTDQSSSIPGDFHAKLENVHRAVKAISNIEEVLQKIHPQWLNLSKAVDARVDKILAVLRHQVIADHRRLLASLGWPPKHLTSNMQNEEPAGIPNPLVLMQGDNKQSYSQSFLALCALQRVQSRREERQHFMLGQKEENLGLWAIDELVSPIASKIEHHLLKWVDQPEFIFALVFKVTHDFIEGVDDVLQPLIDKARLVSCSAKEAWASAMVLFLSGFLAKKVFPVLAVRYRDRSTKSDAVSSWLHLIDNIVRFDKRMQSFISSETLLFLGEAETTTALARGMSALSLFSDRPDWLHIWAKIELKDARNKLKNELKDEKAWLASMKLGPGLRLERESEQYCLATGEDHKAPVVAEFALKTAWEMIQRCQTLPGTAGRIQYIRVAPAKFLWHFLKLLVSRHSSSEIPEYDSEATLVTVCQLINAARFSEFRLQEWSDDIDLLELRLAETGSNKNPKDDDAGNFFSKEVERLIEMETNWLMEIITHILYRFENLSFYYFNNVQQFELPQSALDQVTEKDMFISDDLVEALDNVRSQLLLIKEHLNSKDFLVTWRSVAEGLDNFVFGSILSINVQFSFKGAKQFIADMQGLFLIFKAFSSRPEAFFPCIRDVLELLKMVKEEVEDLKSNLLLSAYSCNGLLSLGISSLSVDQALKILDKVNI